MSKRLILILSFAFVLGIAFAAYAEVQNVKVGGDITTVALSRYGFNLLKPQTDASGLAMIANLKLAADLTDNVSVTMIIRNEKVWGRTGTTTTADLSTTVSRENADLNTYLAAGFVTLKEFLYSPLTLKIGQMGLRLGSGLIVGDPDTNYTSTGPFAGALADLSPRKAFTGMVGVLDYSPLTLTLAGLKVTENDLAQNTDDVNAYAINAAYNTEVKNTIGELYYVLYDAKKNDVNNLGLRVTSSPVENLGVSAEYVCQTTPRASKTPSEGKGHRSDSALLLGANYSLPDVAWAPTLGIDYARLSNNWNVMYEDLTPADIANALFANSNAQVIGISASAKPTEDVTLKLRYANLRLVDRVATLTGWAGGTAYTMTNKKTIGDEIDLHLLYNYTEDVQLGLKLGYFDPGKAFADTNREEAAQVIGSMKVTF